MASKPLLGAGLLAQKLEVRPQDVVLIRGIVEASDGIGVVFAERGGSLTLAAPMSRRADFELLVQDLVDEFGASRAE